jgi:hypothetical protein
MTITGPSSYPPTIALFLTHWDNVNTELGAGGPLVLPDGTTRALLSTMHDDLVNFAATLQGNVNDQEIARGTINISKAALLDRLGEFNRKVRGFLAQSPYANALPDAPTENAGEARILGPLDDCSSLWAKINAATIPNFTPPLLMPDDYPVATFDTDLAALKATYQSYSEAEQTLKVERAKRNDLQDTAKAAMRDYRAAVLGSFPAEHAMVTSLPALSPAPGSTPDAVTASGVWDDMASEAVITWSESSEPNLDRYEIRMTPGASYDTENDTIVGSESPGTLEFRTTDGLFNPGDAASFKVYVVLTTVNEAGSNTVTITRP